MAIWKDLGPCGIEASTPMENDNSQSAHREHNVEAQREHPSTGDSPRGTEQASGSVQNGGEADQISMVAPANAPLKVPGGGLSAAKADDSASGSEMRVAPEPILQPHLQPRTRSNMHVHLAEWGLDRWQDHVLNLAMENERAVLEAADNYKNGGWAMKQNKNGLAVLQRHDNRTGNYGVMGRCRIAASPEVILQVASPV